MIAITTADGIERIVDENKMLYDLKGGDIIRDEYKSSCWLNLICIIAGVDHFLWYKPNNEEYYKHPNGPLGLILLERPGLKYKVGDKIVLDGNNAEVVAIDPETNKYFLTGHAFPTQTEEAWFEKPWWPSALKDMAIQGLWYTETHLEARLQKSTPRKEKSPLITPSETTIKSSHPEEKIPVPGIPDSARAKMPPWLLDMLLSLKAGSAHFVILWGNIHDWQRNLRGEYLSLYEYLGEIFGQRDLLMVFSLSSGLQFATKGMEDAFRSRYLNTNPVECPNKEKRSAAEKIKAGFRENQAASAPLGQLIGETPSQALRFLEKALTDSGDGKLTSVLIIDSAHNLAPCDSGGQNANDKISIEILDRWTRDSRIKESGNTVILLTPSLSSLAPSLRASHSEAAVLRLPKPGEEERTGRWQENKKSNGVVFSEDLTSELLGRLTNGLSLKQIDNVYKLAKESAVPISLDLIKKKKQAILEAEYGDRLKVKMPEHGFAFFGGKDKLKEHMLEIRNNIVNGIFRRAPMGILASGPPGTGKTFFFECWAHECGFNFVEIANPRSMWVGQSEEIAEKMFDSLDDLSPVIVIEDEADQSESSRDAVNGDSGVSNRLRQMKFKFTSDPKRRGKVIWVRISNRSDLIDAAYKREGRSDDTIPFLLPEAEEYEEIFKVMFARYQIPTTIEDFGPFAAETAKKTYCTGASVEWMVLEADKYAGRDGQDQVSAEHLEQALGDWEMKLDPEEIDKQTILAIKGSSKRLRPEHWKRILSEAENRLFGRKPPALESSVFSGFGGGKSVSVKQ